MTRHGESEKRAQKPGSNVPPYVLEVLAATNLINNRDTTTGLSACLLYLQEAVPAC